MKQQNREKGKFGERMARRFLEQKGYVYLTGNYQKKTGEIDLIVRNNDTIVFTEVKLRKSTAYGLPSESVTKTKQKRIIKTALLYLSEQGMTDWNVRFDVVEFLKKDGRWYVRHLENAFYAE